MNPSNLIGKTISGVQRLRHPAHDDTGWLKLTFSDGTSCVIAAEYGMYTGSSMDEYPTAIEILEHVDELIEIQD